MREGFSPSSAPDGCGEGCIAARFYLAFMECFVGRIDVALLDARQCRRCGFQPTLAHFIH